MVTQILVPVGAMAALGLIFGVGLAYALKIFGIEIDPTIYKLLNFLPGANCGACGKAGCAGFAEALKKGEVMPAGCVVTTEEARKSIAEILGIDYNPKVKTVAAIFCGGGIRAKDKYIYKGIKTCKAASLVFGGYKACDYGCLSLGDCVRVCPFDAITMGEDGIPVVNKDRCTSCGNCVKACPKNLYQIVPHTAECHVKCSSLDPASIVNKVCKVGCIACGLCQKLSGGVFCVENNLAKVTFKKIKDVKNIEEVITRCPTKCIVKL